MDCIICDRIIPTGRALVVLEGEVNGAGVFTAKDTVGGLCDKCADREEREGPRKFPFTLLVD